MKILCLFLAALLAGCSAVTAEPSEEAGNTPREQEPATPLVAGEVITQAGTYNLTGGQILIDAGKDDVVKLVLDGVTLRGETGPAIYAKQCKEVEIILAEGSVNTVSDSAEYAASDENEPDAAIFVQDSLTISGSGALNVTGNHNHGIRSQDILTVSGGEVSVTAVGDALRGRDGVAVKGGRLTLNAGGDGIQSNNADDDTKGFVNIDGGEITIQAAKDGIQAESSLTVSGGSVTVEGSTEALEASHIYITGGKLDLLSTDDAINAAGGDDTGGLFGRMGFGGGDYTVDISGGEVIFHAGGDGIDSNGTLNISGGTVFATINSSADNAALDSDGETTVTGGTVIAGGTGTFGNLSSGSTESYVYLTGIREGDRITVTSGGEELVTYAADRALAALAIFAPGIVSGESCEVSVNGAVTSVTAGTGGGFMGGMGGGRGNWGGFGGGQSGDNRFPEDFSTTPPEGGRERNGPPEL
jgi:hypothetical protein